MSDVFPRRNLPSNAEPWGRTVENATKANESKLQDIRLGAESNNLAIAGQMGIVGRQISELGSRVTQTLSMASVTVVATSSVAFSSSSGSISVPGTGSTDRRALVTFSASVTSEANMSGPFITLSFNGQVVFRSTAGYSGGATPADWATGVSAVFSVIVPSGGGSLTANVESSLFTAGDKTATLNSPLVSVYFSDAQ